MNAEDNLFIDERESVLEKTINRLMTKYRQRIDKYIIYPRGRWAFTGFFLFLYILRVLILGGYYVVSYILGLYLLHLGVQFFTPVGVPDLDEEDEDDDMIVGELPTFNQSGQEQGPLIRSMSEFKFWKNATTAILIAVFCTLSDIFDLPVFWPFLLLYFIMLVVLTVKRQLKHMKKYGYNILDFSRKTNK
ncbi:hypothetical protein PPERSA_06953 [Pseudocohnilembus persalinus]|uniref:Protein RER1 n=1 Tax=Pseudocohnilembus persalinus TaxID=266149 RepID=A0A0V0QZ48_PSEPJ|nr:hypothetical protein PPERSA_06953 [Pseudocohnilembus persalinus]|eukprot:KRX07338.1 hypothetical protein PPERSA_06953 [Pseudocohnilembus persalinus]